MNEKRRILTDFYINIKYYENNKQLSILKMIEMKLNKIYRFFYNNNKE